MLENAIYSVISPEGCASILWKDAGRAADAAESLKLTAEDALSFSVIERIISEEALGKEIFYQRLKEMLKAGLTTLCAMPVDQLLEARYQRFRKLGTDAIEEEA